MDFYSKAIQGRITTYPNYKKFEEDVLNNDDYEGGRIEYYGFWENIEETICMQYAYNFLEACEASKSNTQATRELIDVLNPEAILYHKYLTSGEYITAHIKNSDKIIIYSLK